MSELKVQVVKISSVEKHPNADRLDLLRFEGLDWQCVGQRDSYKPGDLVVYFPIDSILPDDLEAKIFGPDAKVKLSNHRIKTIKLRGAISQGMACPLDALGLRECGLGTDVTKILGVTKYEPPQKGAPQVQGKATKKQTNPNFRRYTDIQNFKNYPNVFKEGEEVFITEKLHGSNGRFGWVPRPVRHWWDKLGLKLGLTEKYQFVYGSHNVQLQDKFLAKTYYSKNIYAEMVSKYNLKERIPKGYVFYGEIYGDGIQKNYTYGCKPKEHKIAFFDITVDGRYLDAEVCRYLLHHDNIPQVPLLYSGPFNVEAAKELTKGASELDPSQKIREGIVIKPKHEETTHMGRKILKLISDDYLLLKDNTEFH